MEWLRHEEEIWPMDGIFAITKEPKINSVKVWFKKEQPKVLAIEKMMFFSDSQDMLGQLRYEAALEKERRETDREEKEA